MFRIVLNILAQYPWPFHPPRGPLLRTLTCIMPPYVSYWVEYVELVSLAPYLLYGVEYIDLVSPARFSGQHRTRRGNPGAVIGAVPHRQGHGSRTRPPLLPHVWRKRKRWPRTPPKLRKAQTRSNCKDAKPRRTRCLLPAVWASRYTTPRP